MNNQTKLVTGHYLPYNPDLVGRARELRKNMTVAERKLWYDYLRYFKYPVLRQRPIDNYIVDFYCPQLKLVIEIDGETHIEAHDIKYDNIRTKILEEKYGLRVIRFWNLDVLDGFDVVCEIIERELI
ncbi:endonuclease domain-containing protein [Patescibacteria group bacterium]|nr:endonuclease domain-containing protein [Patescibacteria group bacterium]MBU4455722.1 endonuclease domain-containing protein [Patescibacteria group bacterium]